VLKKKGGQNDKKKEQRAVSSLSFAYSYTFALFLFNR